MKVMRTTVATVVAATLSMSAFSVFAEASPDRCRMQPSLRRCMPNGLTLTRKKPVIKLTTVVSGSSGGVKQIIVPLILVPLTRLSDENWLRKVPDRDWRRGAGG